MFLAQKSMSKLAAAVSYATWNPSAKGAGITLSNGNLTATTSVRDTVLSTIGKSSGKWYWEVLLTVDGGNPGIGIALGSITVSNNYIGSGADGWGYYENAIKRPGAASYGNSFTAGDRIGVALDMDAGALTFYKNNVSQGVAFTGLTGTVYAAVSTVGLTEVDTFVANFGATALTYSPPSGFNAGLYQ